jgi:hypothetical protein
MHKLKEIISTFGCERDLTYLNDYGSLGPDQELRREVGRFSEADCCTSPFELGVRVSFPDYFVLTEKGVLKSRII